MVQIPETDKQDTARAGLRGQPAEEPRRTRRSRLNGQWDDFHVPEEWKSPGWSYQWEVMKVLSVEVDQSEHVRIADGGWEPVRPTEMPGMMPVGYKGNTIDRKGQRLYKRPEYLTKEAKDEDEMIARQQKQAKINQVYGTGQGEATRTVQTIDVKTGGSAIS